MTTETVASSAPPRRDSSFDPYEIVLERQVRWATVQLMDMMSDPPRLPDPRWLRVYSLADRILHRNKKLLERRRAEREASVLAAPAMTTSEGAPIPAHTVSTPPQPESAPQARDRISPTARPAKQRTNRSTSPKPADLERLLNTSPQGVPAVTPPISASCTPTGPTSTTRQTPSLRQCG